jgi:hypothetical protein
MAKANNYLAFFGANEKLIGKSKLSDVLPALQVVASDYNLDIKKVSEFRIAFNILKTRVDNN